MKLSVSLSNEDVEYLDAYAETQGLESRSAALQKAVRRRLAERGLNEVRILIVDPVRGAVQLAQRLLDSDQSTA